MITRLSILPIVLLVVVSLGVGIGYAWQNDGGGGNVQLVITSLVLTSGPSYVTCNGCSSSLSASSVTFTLGPFAPGNSAVLTYTIENEGSAPASLSSTGVSVSQTLNGFTASNGTIPSTLGPGASFRSTITIALKAGLGDSYEDTEAKVTLSITGSPTSTSSTSTCTTTKTVTTSSTQTTTKTTTIKTTTTVTRTWTQEWETTTSGSSCGTTVTSTKSTTVTLTTTVTSTTETTYTTTCTIHHERDNPMDGNCGY